MCRKQFKLSRIIMVLLIISVPFFEIFPQSKSVQIDKLISSYNEGKFNGVVLVAEEGEVIFKKALGKSDLIWNIEADTDHKFLIYSITKQFTALLIMQLVEEGKISLEGKITDYLPYYRKDTGDQITIHHLLTHTHGIGKPDWLNITEMDLSDMTELVKLHLSDDLVYEPGKDFQYGTGVIILAAIIENIYGKSFSEVLKNKIFDPLNMKHTGYITKLNLVKDLAGAYNLTKNGITRRADPWYIRLKGASGLYSTVDDLYLWNQALHNNTLISEESRNRMFTPHDENSSYPYGYCWEISYLNVKGVRKKIVSHDGGGVCRIFRSVDDNHLIVILGNILGNQDNYEIGVNLLNILYDIQ